jgi:long-chain acyl-CoA synthetase
MSLGALLEVNAARCPQKIAVYCEDRQIDYAELDRYTSRLASWLIDWGLKPGDRLALHWPNGIETIQLYFAAFKAGLIAVPVNLRLKTPEIEFVLKHSGARLCFSHSSVAPAAQQAAACPILTDLPAPSTATPLPEVRESDPAIILYTSGTTTRPRGAIHTHASLEATARVTASCFTIAGEEVVLLPMPLMHAAALNCGLLPSILLGATVILIPVFNPASVLDAIERFRVTLLGTLPTLLQFVVEEQAREPRDVSSLHWLIAGGDAVPLTLQTRAQQTLGPPVQELYGMSESLPMTLNPRNAIRPGSIGVAVANIRIVDAQGAVLPDGKVGEIVVQSPINCVGYWNDPEETSRLLRDGWLHTGDLGERDSDGYYWFRGRLKQIIVRGGSNISPQEVEEMLYQHPAVREAGVVGRPDPTYGEVVVAFVALRTGMSVSESELQKFGRQRLADYKVPEQLFFIPELPKGITGKVQRRALLDLLPHEMKASS